MMEIKVISRVSAIARSMVLAMACTCLLAEHSVASPQADAGPAGDWEYLTAYGGTGVWQVRKLRATVRKTGTSIVIEAYDSRGRIAERIVGTLQGKRLKGTRRNLFSEPLDEPLEGTYSQVKDGSRLYEVFTMSNEYWLLGVSRAKNGE
jgi:hypothetical protein